MIQKTSTTALLVALAVAGSVPAAASPSPSQASSMASAASSYKAPECTAIQQLRQPPFAPTDLGLLNNQTYPDGPPMVPAPPRTITTKELTAQLRQTLQERGSRAVTLGMQTFNDPTIKAKIPDPNLRAALASLAGTPGQASIDAVRKGNVFAKVEFGTPPQAGAIAMVVPTGNSSVIVFNERYRYEDFRLLGVVLAHETLHQDTAVNANEEAIASNLNTALYGQLVLENPKLALSRTELSRRLNTSLMALLNTRDSKGNQRTVYPVGNVFPGSPNPLISFGAAFLGPDGTDPAVSPGNANLTYFLDAIVTGGPRRPNFSTSTVQVLDRRQQWATPDERIRLARILRLDTPC